tara:strand:+ start:49 stop:615 length:567 start_codon:yes stop_codon:yes gene_type:complete
MSLIPFGFWAASGEGAGAGAFDLLETTTLTTSASSISFSGLDSYAADYKHLQVRAVGRWDTSFAERTVNMKINGDSGSNYSAHSLFANGSTVQANDWTSDNKIDLAALSGSSGAGGAFGAIIIDILDAFKTTKFKTVRALSGATEAPRVQLNSGLWQNLNATTGITLFEQYSSSNFVAGSRFSLYGVK